MLDDLNILIIDDEADIRNILTFFVQRNGGKAYTAEDAFKALEMIYSEPDKYDVIILDLMLPVLDGFQFAKIIKMQREYNSLPIIMLSALNEKENIKKGFMVGADEYITKPTTEKFFINTIEEIYAKSKTHIEKGREYNIKFELKSDFSYLKEINNMAKWIFNNTKADELVISDLMYSLTEMCTNAIEHGNKEDRTKNVFVECDVFKDKITVIITDEGTGFNPSKKLKELEEADVYRLRGRGMIITQKLMDRIDYQNGGKTVIMEKFF